MSEQKPDPDLHALSSLLLAAWCLRSPAERLKSACFALPEGKSDAIPPPSDVQNPTPAMPTEPIDAAVTQTEAIAALSGAVHPSDLVAAYSRETGQQVLDVLAPHFDRTLSGENWRWTLKSERRNAVLQSLQVRALEPLLQIASRVPTDAAGTVLRQLLRGSTEPAAREQPESAQLQAMSWALPLRPQVASLLEARRRSAALTSLFGADVALDTGGFVGRTTQARAIADFVAGIRGSKQARVLRIAGVGGVGKTTLLAHTLRPLALQALEDPDGPMIVSIDFDRLSVLHGGELELSFELSRQISLYVPHLAAPLRRLREEVARERIKAWEHLKRTVDAGTESLSRHNIGFEYRASTLLAKPSMARRPLVLVIDTFEERERQSEFGYSDEALSRIFDWLVRLRDAWHMQIGVIVSGRTPVAPNESFSTEVPLHLGELLPGDSRTLLRALGVPAQPAVKLARMVGGNPLNLKLAGRHYLSLPPGRREDFLADADAELDGVDAAMRQGVLYKRFLQHIPDERARQLAHPGLALRRVTVELIRKVLAEPCGLGLLNERAANCLFTLLGREIWLVERRGDALVHRPDARRSMIRFMREDSQFAGRIVAIHEAAIRWYESKPSPSAEDVAEAMYHRLMTVAPEQAENVVARTPVAVARMLEQSIDDFPDNVRVLLLDRLGRKLRLADAWRLPSAARVRWAGDQAEHLVQRARPDLALKTWRQLAPDTPAGPWYAAAVFQTGDWEPDYPLINEKHDYSQHLLNYHFLMVHALREQHARGVASLSAGLSSIVWNQMLPPHGRVSAIELATILENLYFLRMVAGQVTSSRHLSAAWKLMSSPRSLDISATAYLRISPLIGLGRRRLMVTHFQRILLGAFQPTPDYLDLIENRLKHMDLSLVRFDRFRHTLEVAMVRPPNSAHVLGSFAERFSRSINMSQFSGFADEFLEPLLQGQRADDPEWRVPIRRALSGAFLPDAELLTVTQAVQELLHPWVPNDLLPASLAEQCRNSPAATWLKVVEYLDRCGKLADFMRLFLGHDDARMRKVASAYLNWINLSKKFLNA